jgi:hypothetical protein
MKITLAGLIVGGMCILFLFMIWLHMDDIENTR